VAGGIAARLRAGHLMVALQVLVGAAVLAAGLLHVVPAALVVWAVWGFVLAIMGAVEQSLEQVLIPQRSFARVLASLSSLGMILVPAGSLLGGFLANRIGAGALYVLIGALDMFTALAILTNPTLRQARVEDVPTAS
jgi:hypothetical protein